jgi:hypothetical protein
MSRTLEGFGPVSIDRFGDGSSAVLVPIGMGQLPSLVIECCLLLFDLNDRLVLVDGQRQALVIRKSKDQSGSLDLEISPPLCQIGQRHLDFLVSQLLRYARDGVAPSREIEVDLHTSDPGATLVFVAEDAAPSISSDEARRLLDLDGPER